MVNKFLTVNLMSRAESQLLWGNLFQWGKTINKIKIEQDHEIERCLREGLRKDSLGKGAFETNI